MLLTFDFVVGSLLVVACVDVITQWMGHVETLDKLVKHGQIWQNSTSDVGVTEPFDIGVDSNQDFEVIFPTSLPLNVFSHCLPQISSSSLPALGATIKETVKELPQ